jgi:hypothetical protein
MQLNTPIAERSSERSAIDGWTIHGGFYFIFDQSKTENFVKIESGILL